MQVLEVINALRSAVEEGKIDMRDEVLVIQQDGHLALIQTVNLPVRQVSKNDLAFRDSQFVKVNLQVAKFID